MMAIRLQVEEVQLGKTQGLFLPILLRFINIFLFTICGKEYLAGLPL
jgi:hypothetical protein